MSVNILGVRRAAKLLALEHETILLVTLKAISEGVQKQNKNKNNKQTNKNKQKQTNKQKQNKTNKKNPLPEHVFNKFCCGIALLDSSTTGNAFQSHTDVEFKWTSQ